MGATVEKERVFPCVGESPGGLRAGAEECVGQAASENRRDGRSLWIRPLRLDLLDEIGAQDPFRFGDRALPDDLGDLVKLIFDLGVEVVAPLKLPGEFQNSWFKVDIAGVVT